ncbi:MAG: GTPase HflX [Bacteroidales bacterium]|nr:GTPase HflX [Bacteroidales bacterium]
MIESLKNGTTTTQQKSMERVVLLCVRTPQLTNQQVTDYLDELAFLAETAGAETVRTFTQNMNNPDSRTYMGSGKLEEIRDFISDYNEGARDMEDTEITTAIVDDELSPMQQKNMEQVLGVMVLDRTLLILDIFASRARTAHAKTQVELAQYQYLLPRLTRMWTHLERQKGGIGMRGPGEKQIETDRRIILDKISLLKEELKHIDRQSVTQRQNRGKMVRVALVGYTNVGKSTLMNAISKSNVFAENKLFATLDTTVRKVVVDNLPFLMADTVGFIRKLPTGLVESFKSTLDEVREADVLLHVIDVSHPCFEQQIEVVEKTIHELDDREKPTVLIFNKIDAFSFVKKDDDDLSAMKRENYSLEDLKKIWMAKGKRCVFISAKEKFNFDELRKTVYEEVKKVHVKRFPYNDFLYDLVEEEK